MDTNEMKEYLKLVNEFNTKTKECDEIYTRLTQIKCDSMAEWRGVKVDCWRDICHRYNEESLINADGDIFFIHKKDFETYNSKAYFGRRVLWNLKLSEEKYVIFETPIYDIDGEFLYYEYVVELDKG